MCCVVATGQSDLESSVEFSQPDSQPKIDLGIGLLPEVPSVGRDVLSSGLFGGPRSSDQKEVRPILNTYFSFMSLNFAQTQSYILRRSGLSFGRFHENSRCKQLKLRGKKIKTQEFFQKPQISNIRILRIQCSALILFKKHFLVQSFPKMT